MDFIRTTTRLTRIVVLDGDTIIATVRGSRERIRLHGIDAPEAKQQLGREATRVLKENMRGEIRFRMVEHDHYGRKVGWLYRRHGSRDVPSDWKCLNIELVRMGLAYAYRQYGGNDPAIQRAQRMAKNDQVGVWRPGRIGEEKPWDNRNANRGTRLLNAAGRALGNWFSRRIYIE